MNAVGSPPAPEADNRDDLLASLRRTQEAARSLTEILTLDSGTRSLEQLLAAVTRRLQDLRWVAPNLGASVVLADGNPTSLSPSSAFGCPHHGFGEKPPCFDGVLRTEEHVCDRDHTHCPVGRTRLRVPIPGERGAQGTIHLCLAEGAFQREAEEFLESVALLLATALRRRRAEARILEAQKREALGRLAGGIAHDFKNLLAVILSTAEVASRELPEGSQTREDLADILDAAHRGLDLTQQLVQLGRPGGPDDETVDPAQILTDMERLLRRTVGARIRLEVSADPAAGRVAMSRTHLEQVILNLAVNARDAMPGGGTLRLETAFEPGDGQKPEVRITVADSGTGIPEAIRARIFEPDFSTKEDRGTGLGLATVDAIVRRAGGTIAVESEVGRGSRFDIRLPAFRIGGFALPVL
jgi:signal transduction histidine kinase